MTNRKPLAFYAVMIKQRKRKYYTIYELKRELREETRDRAKRYST